MAKRAILFLIRVYRRYISPLFPPCCRFYPTCSTYAMQAVEKYGALKGGWLAVKRILRCNPFSKGGYDPVPKRKRRKKDVLISTKEKGENSQK